MVTRKRDVARLGLAAFVFRPDPHCGPEKDLFSKNPAGSFAVVAIGPDSGSGFSGNRQP
jgi:hypothetical protein